MSGGLVYRGYAVELSPGRFSRDHWAIEYARTPDRGGPEQKARPKKRRVGATPTKWQKTGRPQLRVLPTLAELAQTNGQYVLVSLDHEHPSCRPVLARCTGPVCGGHMRRFSLPEWLRAIRGCQRCTSRHRTEAYHASKEIYHAAE